ncbi:MAG: hypothetical protein L3J52_06125 [Proteobacteria bacterium]|nr:hypothetical protein [Pseudomonadota bacterium]
MKTIIILVLFSSVTSAGDLIFKQGFENTVTVSGTVSGLSSSGLSLELNNGLNTETINLDTNGTFVFSSELMVGESWSVEVSTLPDSPQQSCQISNASGIIPIGGVDDVQLICTTGNWNWDEMNWNEGGWQ